MTRRTWWQLAIGLLASALVTTAPSQAQAQAQAKKPNILIIWGDDIGWFNVSAYNHGVMGYRTPNIDRIAKEGCMYTDWPVMNAARPAVQLCWPYQSVYMQPSLAIRSMFGVR